MTEKQRLALLQTALQELKLTGQGYVQWASDKKNGGHWSKAMMALNKLEADLKPSPIPQLGPIWLGGKSVLSHQLSHKTFGIPLYPAFDDAFDQGRPIIAPEALEVVSPLTSSNPGEAFYAVGKSKIRYWFGHLDRRPTPGTKFAKGDSVGRVGANSIGGGPHCHLGINVEALLGNGKQLKYGATGSGPDYTFGAPAVGVQLERMLV
jgi:hypothetical protein